MRQEISGADATLATAPELAAGRIGRAGLLLGWGALLVAVSLATFLVVDPLKYQAIAAVRGGAPLAALPAFLLSCLTPAQWLLIALLPVLLLAALAIERRAAPVSWLLTRANETTIVACLALIAAWFGHSYWVPGYLLAGDSGEHVARFAHFMQAAEARTIMLWDPTAYEGSPFLQFTGPLLFWLGGIAALLAGDPTIGTKALLFLLHVASGLAFYGFLRALALGSGAAFIAALAYVGAFAHLHTMLYRGEFPQALVLLFLPLLFWSAERLLAQPRIGCGAWLALAATLAAFLYAHQTTAFYAGLYLALYLLIRGGFLPAFAALASAAVGGLLMALPAVLPILLEHDGVVMATGLWIPRLALPSLATFDHLLVWRNIATSHGGDSTAYIGLSTALLMVAAIALRGDKRPRAFWFPVLALPLALVVHGSFVRDMMFLLFFGCWLAGYGAERLLAVSRWRQAPGLVALLLLLDLGPTAIQPQARTDKDWLDAAGAYLAAAAPNARVASMALHDDTLVPDIGPSASPLFYHPVPALHGPHNSTATLAHNYLAAIGQRAAADLDRDGRLAPATERLLGWLDVHRIIATGSSGMGLPPRIAGSEPEGPLGRTLIIRDAAPVRVAGRLVTLAPDPALDRPMLWLEDFADRTPQVQALDRFLDRVAAIEDAIPVRGAAPSEARPAPLARLRDYRVAWNRTDLVLDSDGPGYVELAHAWYPGLTVRVNGARVAPLEGSFGLVVLPIAAGRSAIEISLALTPVRTASAAVALMTMLLAGLLYARNRRWAAPALARG